jgi:nucleotide-binding universal stress UspA family protein
LIEVKPPACGIARLASVEEGNGMQDILAYTSSFATWSRATAHAARLAGALDASLTGLYVSPSPLAMAPTYETPELMTYVLEGIRELVESASAAAPAFVRWAGEHGVKKAAWQVAEGDLPSVLGHIGNWHDLLVLERTPVPEESAAELGRIALSVEIPCLIVPPEGTPSPTPECIAVAWNGSPEAIRAIHAARPLLARAGRVVVLSGTPRKALTEIDWKPQFDLGVYLRRHGVHAEERRLLASDEEAGPALLAAAAEVGAGLLVMGAYGRTRFSEWFFGGATRHVLNHADIPVVMRH